MNFLRNSAFMKKGSNRSLRGGSKRNGGTTSSGSPRSHGSSPRGDGSRSPSPRDRVESVSSESSFGAGTLDKLETFNLNVDQLVMGEELGRGNFSVVRKAKMDSLVVAVKVQRLTDPDLERYLRKELAVLKLISHPGLVRYMGAGKRDNSVYIVTEYLTGGDLRRLLKSGEPMGWRLRVRLVTGVAAALAYLHARGIIHRDGRCRTQWEGNGRECVCFGIVIVIV
jgi:hypothetical protein